jgi:hypothetical protein
MSDAKLSEKPSMPSTQFSRSAWVANGILATTFIAYCVIDAIQWGGGKEGYAAAGVTLTALLVVEVWTLILCARAFWWREAFLRTYSALVMALALLNAWIFKTAFFGGEVIQYAKEFLAGFAAPALVPSFSLIVVVTIWLHTVLTYRTKLSRFAVLAFTSVIPVVGLLLLPAPLFLFLSYTLVPYRHYQDHHLNAEKLSGLRFLKATPEFHADLAARCVSLIPALYERTLPTGRVSEERLILESSGRFSEAALQGLTIKNPRVAAQVALPLAKGLINSNWTISNAIGKGLTLNELVWLIKDEKMSEMVKWGIARVFQREFPELCTDLSEQVLESYGQGHQVIVTKGYFTKSRKAADVRRIWSKLLVQDDHWKAAHALDFYADAPLEFSTELFNMLEEDGTLPILLAAFQTKDSNPKLFSESQLRKLILRTVAVLDEFAQSLKPTNPKLAPSNYVACIEFVAHYSGLSSEKVALEPTPIDWFRGVLSDAQYKLLLQDFCQKVREKMKE